MLRIKYLAPPKDFSLKGKLSYCCNPFFMLYRHSRVWWAGPFRISW